MQRSTDRFLTTHTGSLPRPDDLIRMMYAKEEGVPVDAGRARRADQARRSPRWCSKQADAGVDLINDGEMSKPSYATYIKDRLDGFGGTGNTFVYQDLAEFPRLEQTRVRRSRPLAAQDAGLQRADHACATATRPQADADNLKAALAGVKAAGGFMSAASPGVVSLFFRNDYYKDFESYIYAIADAMRARIRDRRQGRLRAADRLPRPRAWAGTSNMPISTSPEFRKRAQLHVEALNHARREHPGRATAHAPVLGQLRRPASLRRAARRHHRHRVQGQAVRDLARSRQSAPRARMDACSRRSSCRTARC